jgi:hypothetical protein
MTDWRDAEPIPNDLGGGVIKPGPYGCLHLIGRNWRWWQCSTCRAVRDHDKEHNRAPR